MLVPVEKEKKNPNEYSNIKNILLAVMAINYYFLK